MIESIKTCINKTSIYRLLIILVLFLPLQVSIQRLLFFTSLLPAILSGITASCLFALAFFASKVFLRKSTSKADEACQLTQSEKEMLFREMIDFSHNPIFVANKNNEYLYMNQSFKEFFNINTQRKDQTTLDNMILQQFRKEMLSFANPAGPDQPYKHINNQMLCDARGNKHWVNIKYQILRADEHIEPIYLGSINDVSDIYQVQEKLSYERSHDSLTGLPNQIQLTNILDLLLSQTDDERNYAILLLDIDNFKRINDGLGYVVGDQLLIAVANRIKTCLRSSDIVARLKSDEFAILLQDIQENDEVFQVIERITNKLSEPFMINGHEIKLSASIGVVFNDNQQNSPGEMLLEADIAMGKAKKMGKARFVIFTHEMRSEQVSRLQIETELRHALERNQLRVHYQPIAELTTGKVIGVEALMRWQHPEKGLVFPKDFISIAEETELIIPLGYWILEEACRQTYEWQKKHKNLNITVSVNISISQLMHPDFVAETARILDKTKLKPQHLKLEITESIYLEKSRDVQEVLNSLNDIGVKLFIDDFGTGYSSLSYLSHLPFDAIKIDRSFINGIVNGNGSTGIIKAIVQLARNLGKQLVAEGVETQEQRDRLKLLGCDFEQGYLLCKPNEADIIEEFFED